MRKKSLQQETILRIIINTATHPSAEWIFRQAKMDLPGIGLATVYRNLKILKENGQIKELHGQGSISRYDGNTSIHHHFFCEKCGKIEDLAETRHINLDALAQLDNGYRVTHRHLELSGLCPDCLTPTPEDKV